MELETKTVRAKGRPKKYFDTSKVYEWVDESAFQSAKRDYKRWEDAFSHRIPPVQNMATFLSF